MKLKRLIKSIAGEFRFQVSEFKRNTMPLRTELKLMSIEHMEVIRRHSQPIVDAMSAAVKAQVKATRKRHRKEKSNVS